MDEMDTSSMDMDTSADVSESIDDTGPDVSEDIDFGDDVDESFDDTGDDISEGFDSGADLDLLESVDDVSPDSETYEGADESYEDTDETADEGSEELSPEEELDGLSLEELDEPVEEPAAEDFDQYFTDEAPEELAEPEEMPAAEKLEEAAAGELDEVPEEPAEDPFDQFFNETEESEEGGPQKVLRREITPEILEGRARDTEEVLDNYRENLREYGVDEDRIEQFVSGEREKMNAEYDALDHGDMSHMYMMPNDWKSVADSLSDQEMAEDPAAAEGLDESAVSGLEEPLDEGPEALSDEQMDDLPDEGADDLPDEGADDLPGESLDDLPDEELDDLSDEELEQIPGETLEDMPGDGLEQAAAAAGGLGEDMNDVPSEEPGEVPGEELEEVPDADLEAVPDEELEGAADEELEDVSDEEPEEASGEDLEDASGEDLEDASGEDLEEPEKVDWSKVPSSQLERSEAKITPEEYEELQNRGLHTIEEDEMIREWDKEEGYTDEVQENPRDARIILPRNTGTFVGEVGNSAFIPKNEAALEKMREYGRDSVEYVHKFPDFSPFTKHMTDWGELDCEVKIGNMTPYRENPGDEIFGKAPRGESHNSIRELGNFAQADNALWEKLPPEIKENVTPLQIEKFRESHNLVWHECEDMETMQLIPREIHDACRHTGGVAFASEIRRDAIADGPPDFDWFP